MKQFNMKTLAATLLLAMGILQSCSNHDDLDNYTPTNFNVVGKVEKGPFVRGTSIQMQPLDADLDETGQSYTSSITDNEGTFTFGSKLLQSPYVKLAASGYYFNEVTGDLSAGTLALNAVADLQDAQTVNVNILSHLKYQRVLRLVKDHGLSFKDANKQAQQEVLTAFGLQKYAQTDVNRLSITAGTDGAAALIAVSSMILSDRSEAEVTEYLSVLSEDFAKNGTFSDDTKLQLRKDMFNVKDQLTAIADNIKNRYAELGKDVTVKNLVYFFDWDGDGVAGNEIPAEGSFISLDQTEIRVPKEGGTYEVKVNTTVPVFAECPDIPGDNYPSISIPSESYRLTLYADGTYTAPSIDCQKELSNNVLKVTIGKAVSKKTLSTSIPIYNALGNEVARLQITQEGDPNLKVAVPLLGKDGKNVVDGFLYDMALATTLNQSMDRRYTKITNDPHFVAPISSSDSNVRNLWSYYSTSIGRLANIYKVDAEQRAVYAPFLNVYRDLCYYNMVTWWGGVILVPNEGFSDAFQFSHPRSSETEVLSRIETELSEALPDLDEKRNVALATNADEALFVSKDVARIILAKVYMYRHQWQKAKDLLEQVVSKGLYAIEKVPASYTASSKDLILGFEEKTSTRTGSAIVPILTLTDTELLYAECLIYLNKASEAAQYLSKVSKTNGLTTPATSIAGLNQLRKSLKLQDYFAFLKRNGLALSELGLQQYQLLLPIPDTECASNPAMTQNPQY